MEDTPVLKWTLAALGVIVACFCLGYFVLGPSPRTQHVQPAGGVQVAEVPEGTTSGSVLTRPRPSTKPGLILEDQTSEYEAKLKKAEDDKRKAEEARKKAEEALRLKELEAASPTPSPSVEVIDPSPSPEATATPDVASTEPNTPPPVPDTVPVEAKPAIPEPRIPATKPVAPHVPTPKPPTPEPKPPTNALYKVQVGSYGTREAAKTVSAELQGRGFSTLIVTEESGSKSTFHVQVGAFKSKATAESTQRELQANGYDATVN